MRRGADLQVDRNGLHPEINIVCCLWGEFPAPGLSGTYVERLRNGVKRHLQRPHNFICFTNEALEIDVETRPLEPPVWTGNLPKNYVYSPAAGLKGRTLMLDLDNVIVGALDDMIAYDGPLCVRGRLALNRTYRLPDGDMISFDARGAKILWHYAQREDVRQRTNMGREREFIYWAMPKCDQWQTVCPGQVVSYKYDCRRKGLPRNARIISMHGKPRPHEVEDDYIVANWK